MKTQFLICLTLWSLYITGCLTGENGTNRAHPHTGRTSDTSIPWGASPIIDTTELQPHGTDTP